MPRKTQELQLQILLLISDIITIILSFYLAFWIRFYSGWIPVTKGMPDTLGYLRALFFTVIIWLYIFHHYGLYQIQTQLNSFRQYSRIVQGVLFGSILLMAVTFLFRTLELSRLAVLFGMIINMVGLSVSRYFVSKFIFFLQQQSTRLTRIVIIGTGNTAQFLANKIQLTPLYQFLGFVISSVKEGALPEIKGNGLASEPITYNVLPPYLSESQKGNLHNSIRSVPQKMNILGSIDNLEKIVAQHQVDEVLIASSRLSHDQILDLMVKCEQQIVRFRFVPDLLEIITNRVIVDELDGFPLFTVKETPLTSWNVLLKRGMDLVVSSIALVVLSPLMLWIAYLIKRDSPGNVWYTQKRVGADGKQFMIYKFRTMFENAETETGPVWATKNDPRCTKIGKYLRKNNMDELPQLINVIKGDMSLVGPRPERPHFVEQFKNQIPRYMLRHKVKSGMTGWAQINGWRGDSSIEERTKYDLYYIENWSFLFDCKILLLTFFANKNAY